MVAGTFMLWHEVLAGLKPSSDQNQQNKNEIINAWALSASSPSLDFSIFLCNCIHN